MSDKCTACDNDILNGDIFLKLDIDMHRLIYNEFEGEENFLVPDGPVRFKSKLYLCDVCSQGLMGMATKDMAVSIVKSIKK